MVAPTGVYPALQTQIFTMELTMLKAVASTFRTRLIIALAAVTVLASSTVAQELGELDECFVWCHDGHMEMLEKWPLFIVKFSFKLCMEHACGSEM